jgi:hypothetical protein
MPLTPSQQPSADRATRLARAQAARERNQFSIGPLTLQMLGAQLLSAQEIQDALESETGGRVAGECKRERA